MMIASPVTLSTCHLSNVSSASCGNCFKGTISKHFTGMAVVLKFVNRHNSVLTIDVQDPANVYYHEILDFLLRWRIHHLITYNPVVVASYIHDFWTSAQYDSAANPAVIRATVNGLPLHFSLADLRRILQLGDAAQDNERMEFPTAMRAGAFGRMGYNGDATQSIIKNGLYGQWRFLAHVVIQCLSARKAGFDFMNAREQSLMIALVYNKPYSFSRYFFEAFRTSGERNGRDKFLLFPRFVMMIILDRLPGIPIVGGTLSVVSTGGRIFTDCRSNKTNRPVAELETALFGHLVNENYVAPPNEGWDDISVVQQKGEVPDIGIVGAEAAVQQPQQQAPPVVDDEQVHVNDILDQGVAEEIVHAVLQENSPVEDVLADVDNFQAVGAGNVAYFEDPGNFEDLAAEIAGFEAGGGHVDVPGGDDVRGDDMDIGIDESDSDSSDSDYDDGFDEGSGKLGLYGKKVVGVLSESSSRKRKDIDEADEDYAPSGDDEDFNSSQQSPPLSKIITIAATSSTISASC